MAGKRRQYGTGTVHFDKARNRWVGAVEAGWTAAGRRRRITVTSTKSEAEAKRKLRDKQLLIARDGVPAQGANFRITLRAWVDQWWARREKMKLSPDTILADRSQLDKWLLPTIGHRRLAELTPADVRKVHDARVC